MNVRKPYLALSGWLGAWAVIALLVATAALVDGPAHADQPVYSTAQA